MSFSKEEQILRELQLINAQVNPTKATLKALLLLVLCAIVFTATAVIVNSAAFPRHAVHANPVSKGGHARPSYHPRTQLIKESL
jgi:hypothetical protein